MTNSVQILAISDDTDVRNVINTSFGVDSSGVMFVSSHAEALQLLNRGVVVDVFLYDASSNKSQDALFAADLLRHLASEKLCILSESGDTFWHSYAEKWPIKKVLTKPLRRQDLEKLTSQRKFPRDLPTRHHAATSNFHLEELENNRFFLAASPAMMRIYREVRLLAPVDIPVLILGESGVGKEVVATLLHKYHANSERNFLNVNCAALPSELLESELFGYEAGAFTGAVKAKPGKFELADKGTLLLDEIGEMHPQMQAKLLHVLQDGSFCRLGARVSTQVDVRVLAATNVNMTDALAEKRFREDLYYRLNTLTITVPPLRDRPEEIPYLMRELIRRGKTQPDQPPTFSDKVIEAAQDYHWPGNLRELRNFVTRTLILQDEESAYNDLRAKTRANTPPHPMSIPEKRPPVSADMRDIINGQKTETEISMLGSALSASGWNRRRAAKTLNIPYRTLLYKIQRYGLNP